MIGFRFSWLGAVNDELTLVSPFRGIYSRPGRVVESVCPSPETHTAGCRCGVYFFDSLGSVDVWLRALAGHLPAVIEVLRPRGTVRRDHAIHNFGAGGTVFGTPAFRVESAERVHLWVPTDADHVVQHFRRSYACPVSSGPPTFAEQRRVLLPLGVTDVHQFQFHLAGPGELVLRRAALAFLADQSAENVRRMLDAARTGDAVTVAFTLADYGINLSCVVDCEASEV